jgi:mRNA interferase MazF
MSKEFDRWGSEKKTLHVRHDAPFYHEREIWWCALGVNVGFEQDGTGKRFDRPVVIIKGFSRQTLFAVPLTGKKKSGRFHFPIGAVDGREASAILSQVRVIDTKRLLRKVRMLDDDTFADLVRALQSTLFRL